MASATKKLTILVVDDDPGMLITLTDVLSASGFEVDSAASGAEAIEKVRGRVPDCILMDQRMPGLNGLETLRRIKPLAPESFIVFMTAYSSPSFAEEAIQEGAIGVVPKPLDLEELMRLLTVTAATTPVLVIDDHPEFGRSLRDSLSAHSFDVDVAQTVEEAVARFRREPRRVVILDMKLNGQTGLDVLPKLKELNPHAVVILISGFAEFHDDMQRGLDMSAAAAFTKPLVIEDLIGTIQDAVEQRRAERLFA